MPLSLLFASLALPGVVPPISRAVVYEANLRAEGPPVGFASLTRRLRSIRDLGVNVLWLMPVTPTGKLRSAGGLGSPYAFADFDRVNPEFGTEKDLRTLVREAHRLNMAVLLDWVANHTAWDHPWLVSHPDWYVAGPDGKPVHPPGTNWQDVAELDFGKPEMRRAMIAAMQGWIDRYGIDGFRCDSVDYVPLDFWREATASLRKHTPRRLFLLAEGQRDDFVAAGFDAAYGWHFSDGLRDVMRGKPATALAEAARSEAKSPRLRFVTNHDKSAWEGTPIERFGSPEAVQTAFAITAFYGGIPLVYSGQEVAWRERIPIFEHTQIDWRANPETRREFARILRIRNRVPALTAGEATDESTSNVVVLHRRLGQKEALFLANVRDHSSEVARAGDWRDAETGVKIDLRAGLRLAPFQYRVFVRP